MEFVLSVMAHLMAKASSTLIIVTVPGRCEDCSVHRVTQL